MNPGSKREPDLQYPNKRDRLASCESLDPKKECKELPLEIWTLVASYLDKTDLKSLCLASKRCKAAALSVKNVQEMKLATQEMQEIANFDAALPEKIASTKNFYQQLIHQICRLQLAEDHDRQKMHPEKFAQLKQMLIALSTQQVREKILNLQGQCFQDISSNLLCFTCVEEKYHAKKTNVILQALNHIIAFSNNPQYTTGWIVKSAAENGILEVVQALLANQEISNPDRGCSVLAAADKGYLAIIHVLLASGDIVNEDRGQAVEFAAWNGYLEIVQTLLANGKISDVHHGWAVYFASQKGYLAVIEALLAHCELCDLSRKCAFNVAVAQGYLEIGEVLLANGAVSYEDARGVAVWRAARDGHLEDMQKLFAEGEISSHYTGFAMQDAEKNGHKDILKCLSKMIKNNKDSLSLHSAPTGD